MIPEIRSFDDHGTFRRRDFSPEYFDEIFASLGVTAVVTAGDDVDSGCGQGEGGRRSNIAHHLLPFGGGAVPPPAAAARFFRILDAAAAAGGAVAVQSGGAGRGPTGTLAALCLMRTHGFTAREAIAWVRIMRPVPARPRAAASHLAAVMRLAFVYFAFLLCHCRR